MRSSEDLCGYNLYQDAWKSGIIWRGTRGFVSVNGSHPYLDATKVMAGHSPQLFFFLQSGQMHCGSKAFLWKTVLINEKVLKTPVSVPLFPALGRTVLWEKSTF